MTGSPRLNETVALVTGASSGIGAATARALAAEGAAVALVARRLDRLDDLAKEIRASGGAALPIEGDVTERSAAESAVQRTVDELGRLDTLINNAGVMALGPVLGRPHRGVGADCHRQHPGAALYCASIAQRRRSRTCSMLPRRAPERSPTW